MMKKKINLEMNKLILPFYYFFNSTFDDFYLCFFVDGKGGETKLGIQWFTLLNFVKYVNFYKNMLQILKFYKFYKLVLYFIIIKVCQHQKGGDC